MAQTLEQLANVGEIHMKKINTAFLFLALLLVNKTIAATIPPNEHIEYYIEVRDKIIPVFEKPIGEKIHFLRVDIPLLANPNLVMHNPDYKPPATVPIPATGPLLLTALLLTTILKRNKKNK